MVSPHRGLARGEDPEVIHHEENIQRALFAWLRIKHGDVADQFIHVPNGGYRSKATAGRLKSAGVRRGVPDILGFVPRQGFVGLAIELKATGGRLSPQQAEWLDHLNSIGWLAVVCVGLDKAQETIASYLREG